MTIDYTYIHDKKCELFDYLINFIKETAPRTQIDHELYRAMCDVAFHEKESTDGR